MSLSLIVVVVPVADLLWFSNRWLVQSCVATTTRCKSTRTRASRTRSTCSTSTSSGASQAWPSTTASCSTVRSQLHVHALLTLVSTLLLSTLLCAAASASASPSVPRAPLLYCTRTRTCTLHLSLYHSQARSSFARSTR